VAATNSIYEYPLKSYNQVAYFPGYHYTPCSRD